MVARLFLFLALLLAPVAASAQGPAPAAPTPEQRRQIEQIVREYLIANPEVLREALGAMERREQEAQARAQTEAVQRSTVALFQNPRDAVLGNPNGDVTIVEFFDYNCGFCKRALADMQAIVNSDRGVRWVLKEFPVLGPGSVEAAHVSAQLSNHPRFSEFHRNLLSERGPVNRATAVSAARGVGADTRALEAGVGTGPIRERIQEVYDLANTLNIGGTPTYVIGTEVIVGAVGVEELRARIASMRRCGRTNCG